VPRKRIQKRAKSIQPNWRFFRSSSVRAIR
jgi:hypothetical protein